MDNDIKSKLLNLNGKPFEIFYAGDQESRQLAIFLHGFPQCAYAFRHQMKLLAAMGYKCWALNQRGYGLSFTPPDVADYHINHLMNDVAEAIDMAQSETVTLIAHDWGAAVAWQFAIKKIRPLDRLVIMNVPHPAVFALECKKWRQIKKSWYIFFFQIPTLPDYLLTKEQGKGFKRLLKHVIFRKDKFSEEDVSVYTRNVLRPGGMTAMINWYRAAFKAIMRKENAFLEETKITLQIPTLMIWGEQDVALSIYTTLGTDKYVDHFTIRYIPNAGHFVQEEAPEETNQILQAWLKDEDIPGHSAPSKR